MLFTVHADFFKLLQLLTFLLTRKLPVTASPWVKLSMQLASRFKYPLVCVRWNMKPLLFTFPLISQQSTSTAGIWLKGQNLKNTWWSMKFRSNVVVVVPSITAEALFNQSLFWDWVSIIKYAIYYIQTHTQSTTVVLKDYCGEKYEAFISNTSVYVFNIQAY